MQGIKIVATGRALPQRIVTNEELSKRVDTTDEWIRTRTGIGQRYICENETCTSLAVRAAEKAMEKAGIGKDQVEAIVVATATSDLAFPSTACMVQKALGFPKELMAFDISAGCSGFLYGLGVARGLLLAGKKEYVLLIGSEQLSRITDFSDRSTCVLFGDGAGAAVISLTEQPYAYRAWADGEAGPLFCPGVGIDGARLHMEGNQVFKFAVKAIAQGVEAILKDTKMSIGEIDFVVCHQANQRIIEHVKKKYEGTKTVFYMNMENHANTSAASIPIALDEMGEKGLLKPGMKMICVGFGAGFTWGSALLTI
ncbi:MAG: beta-ketoacyl-ACP synthase III [Lachnospiraceae bacterium]|nr:ketoacyl-ACP synthase III [Lachnospiraceae bacterium]MDY3222961.1 beta-ketoacyl-ACP synthase III [Lachnospiraceae bacterium]